MEADTEQHPGVWRVARWVVLCSIIFLSGLIIADEAVANLFFRLELPPALGRRPAPPLYQALSEEEVIFSGGDTILKKKTELTIAGESFIFADLTTQTLTLYEKGQEAQVFPIKAAGKNATFFETPNGYYRMRFKERNHFSTIGKVWMPWSMHFFGNYFIHGWPYYPNGAPVAETFSGGCIRLSTVDAELLFSRVQSGMAVLVYAGGAPQETITLAYFKKIASQKASDPAIPAIPEPAAASFLAIDIQTGQVLMERDRASERPLGSIAKLMTGLVAVETINRFKIVTLKEHMLTPEGNTAALTAGESYNSQDLLYPLLLTLSDDIARFYKDQVWGFVGIMNEKARAIGLTHTHFTDAQGADLTNVSTSEDLFRFLQFLYLHKKPLLDITAKERYTLFSVDKDASHELTNVSWPKDIRFVAGLAGPWGEGPGGAMAAIFRLRFSEYGDRLVAVTVMDSPDRIADTRSIIALLEQNFVYGTVFTHQDQNVIRTTGSIYETLRGLKYRR